MKIRKIEFENFRNFKEHGEIKCSVDGKVTIVYGKNGDGKTTLHQLCQWVFYGMVHFNKTTTNHLYNLEFESEQPYNSVFEVMGRIDFEHDKVGYSLTRVYQYRKDLDDSTKIGESLELIREDSDNNWKPVDRPQEVIEKLLPSGLSDYFFFDGESMIADLKVKGSDSAKKLRTALYSIFDLDILDSALEHIGDIQYKTTVLGQVYLDKANIGSGSEISAIKTNIENAQTKIEEIQDKLSKAKSEKKEKQDFINYVSEQIGETKSKADYEIERKKLQENRDRALKSIEIYEMDFGNAVMESYPQLLISKAVEDAKKTIHLKVEKTKLPSGITKRLIAYLLSAETKNCICGNPLCDAERQHLREFENMMPPRSYDSVYSEFSQMAKSWGKGYDRNKLDIYIQQALNNSEAAEEFDREIRELDNEQKKSPDIEQLVVDRRNAEVRIGELDETIIKLESEKKKFEIYLKNQMREFDIQTSAIEENAIVSEKLTIMKAVKEYFSSKKDEESKKYSEKLQENIQKLIDTMLTSKRYVKVSPEFTIKVTDSFNDESKSEGQFAVVSFAYIGGIFSLLKTEERLSDKEYPLVLDGPFSKLDPDQRQNVIDTIPAFAPQVILFSKDDLNAYFSPEVIGKVWTIESNREKNVAQIKEGYLWK